MDLREQRSTTPQGDLLYEDAVSRYSGKLLDIQRHIDALISGVQEGEPIELSQIQHLTGNVDKYYEQYEKCVKDYESFLVGHRTSESASAAQVLRESWKITSDQVKLFIFKLQSKLPGAHRSSVSSRHSKRSSHSSHASSHVSSVLLKQTAKVVEAKARLKYAAEEAELIKKEAEIKASLSILKVKRELEEAETGLGAIRQVLDFSEKAESYIEPIPKLQEEDNFLTERYIAESAKEAKPQDSGQDLHHSTSEPPEPTHVLRPQASPFYSSKQNETSNLAMLVTKNQLLPKRLTHFNDKPERYLSWKYSFLSIMDEIKASTLEQLDLLTNHLGPESKAQAENIRASNPRAPQKAIDDIWERLDRGYGSVETIEAALKKRIESFPSLTDTDRKRYFDFSDLAAEVESVKCDPVFAPMFTYYDTSGGINDFVRKLPKRLRGKWATECDRYKVRHGVHVYQAPFSVFTKFLRDIARVRNDPSFAFDSAPGNQNLPQNKTKPHSKNQVKNYGRQGDVSVQKTEVEQSGKGSNSTSDVKCPLHPTNSNHQFRDCRKFQAKSYNDRKEFLFKNGYCLRCCGLKRHLRKNCKETLSCKICHSTDHVTVLHSEPRIEHEGEQCQHQEADVKASCTEICNSQHSTSKSCAKIILVKVFHQDAPSITRDIYCMIDDQSNRSLATSAFFNEFSEFGPETEYILSSCAGKVTTSGRKATGYIVQSCDGSCTLKLPCLIECNDLPSNRNEIPTRSVALSFPHLNDIASDIPPVKDNINIELLIGRDLISAHHVIDQRLGHDELPCGQKLPLGWVIIGEVCLDRAHQPEIVGAYKTSILSDGRPSHLQPCDSNFTVKEDHIFRRTPDDEKPGLSVEDKAFLNIMDTNIERTVEGNWQAPLPFRTSRHVLPDNRPLALRRAKSFDVNLKCNPVKQEQVINFMRKLLDNGHAELAPTIPASLERWYLPMFAVYHPKKPDSVRVVFDSSARYQDISLNSVLLQGPDLCNSLLGILLRFRRERVAITMDVEQMFHNFKVPEDQRRYLRFLWHQDNDCHLPLIDYQMTVHVFGNTTSPAIATYSFRKVVEQEEDDIQDLINKNFYVDDGLLSCSSEEAGVDLVLRAKQALQDNGNIRLHKFASNSREVLNSFKQDDLANNLKDLDLGTAYLPIQRSLGLLWDTETDMFTFKVNHVEKPYTRRGLLSTINSVYDPIGFVQPVIVQGKLLLREMTSITSNTDWDDPLPENLHNRWCSWVDSLSSLENLHIPRMFGKVSFECASRREVLVYSDASKDVIAAVAYLKLYQESSQDISFLLGKAKIAPTHGHTIPRLELCAAVLATEIAETVQNHLDIPADNFYFFSDSQVVLGYIYNESRRFYIYVGNRVSRIRLFSKPAQWTFVPSENNPADVATRIIDVAKLGNSKWILGPTDPNVQVDSSGHHLVQPDTDVEIRPNITCNKLEYSKPPSLVDRFDRFSDWSRLVRAVARLKYIAYRFGSDDKDTYNGPNDPRFLQRTEYFIISLVQQDVYEEFQDMKHGKPAPNNSSIRSLNPFVDPSGILRVGGRFKRISESVINLDEKHPIILPKNNHISRLILRHYHRQVFHQGRNFTEGALRAAGYWLVGSKRMISSEISKCVICRTLRGKLKWQQMDDLPADRCTPAPSFSYVGVDTFGPWPVIFRRTRGGSANHKRWALLFTCLVTRAIHIEVIEELSSSAFINALRRFIAIRGPVIQFRSDRGTNFIGAVDDLSIDVDFVEKGPIAKFLSNSRSTWKFNPPHAPHMGGAWERLIGTAKRILNSMLLQNKCKDLTHDVLTTFMAEVSAIVNNRPLTDVSSDPDSPNILTPSMLLTLKTKQDVSPFPSFGSKDALKSAWKRVQVLADEFWHKWRSEYLQKLQVRGKWQGQSRNMKSGDLVLVKNEDCSRNEWPRGVIQKTFPSDDGHVRKVEVAIFKDNKRVVYVRPITELVMLLEADL